MCHRIARPGLTRPREVAKPESLVPGLESAEVTRKWAHRTEPEMGTEKELLRKNFRWAEATTGTRGTQREGIADD